MKKYINIGIVCLLGIVLSSCGKTMLSELSFSNEDGDYLHVKKDGKNFKGEAWTEDCNSLKIVSDANGLVQQIVVYHPNGNICAIAELDSKGHIEPIGHYNESGYLMNERHWENVYGDYVDKIMYTMLPKELREFVE